jgi:hypothetical protein
MIESKLPTNSDGIPLVSLPSGWSQFSFKRARLT